MVMELELTQGDEHSIVYRQCVVKLCNRNLYNFLNQCHPNKFNKET